jgi:hypothetical protein
MKMQKMPISRFLELVLSVTILLAWPFNAAAPMLGVPLNYVYIVNTGNKDITFQMRPDNGDWGQDTTIASGGDQLFTCSHCTAFEIKIGTDQKTTSRTLMSQKRYGIFWNSDEGLWDIQEIK